MAKKEPKFDFDKDLKAANKIEDFPERLLFLQKRLKDYKQYTAIHWSEVSNWNRQEKRKYKL